MRLKPESLPNRVAREVTLPQQFPVKDLEVGGVTIRGTDDVTRGQKGSNPRRILRQQPLCEMDRAGRAAPFPARSGRVGQPPPRR